MSDFKTKQFLKTYDEILLHHGIPEAQVETLKLRGRTVVVTTKEGRELSKQLKNEKAFLLSS